MSFAHATLARPLGQSSSISVPLATVEEELAWITKFDGTSKANQDYICAARHYAVYGTWPDDTPVPFPDTTYLAEWEIKWLRKQSQPGTWQAHRQREHEQGLLTQRVQEALPDAETCPNQRARPMKQVSRPLSRYLRSPESSLIDCSKSCTAPEPTVPAGSLNIAYEYLATLNLVPQGIATDFDQDAWLKEKAARKPSARQKRSARDKRRRAAKRAVALEAEIQIAVENNEPLPIRLTLLAENASGHADHARGAA